MNKINIHSDDFLPKVNEIVKVAAEKHDVKPAELFMELCDGWAEDGFNAETYEKLAQEVDRVASVPRKTLVIKMKGSLEEINKFCQEVGEVSNKYDIEVEF